MPGTHRGTSYKKVAKGAIPIAIGVITDPKTGRACAYWFVGDFAESAWFDSEAVALLAIEQFRNNLGAEYAL